MRSAEPSAHGWGTAVRFRRVSKRNLLSLGRPPPDDSGAAEGQDLVAWLLSTTLPSASLKYVRSNTDASVYPVGSKL